MERPGGFREAGDLAPALGLPADPGLAPALAGPWRLGPHDQLQAAIAQAPAGAELALPAGTWRLSAPLRLDRPLTLTGAGPGPTRLIGPDDGGPALIVAAGPGDRISLQDLAIGLGTASDGIHVICGTLGLQGVHLAGAVRVAGPGRLDARACEITGTAGSGIRLLAGAHATLTDVVLAGHAGFGLHASGDAQVEARGLVARGNGRGGVAIDGARATLDAGRLTANGRRGVVVWAQGACTLRDHQVDGNFGPGIEIISGSGVTLAGNRCHGNRGPGILIGERVRLAAEANQCEGNEGDGLAVLRGACARLAGNRAHGNARYGIWVANGAEAALTENQADGNRLGDLMASWGAQIDAPPAGLAAVRRRSEAPRAGGLPAARGRSWR